MDADDVYDPNAEVLGELGAFSPDYDPRTITLVKNTLPIEETVFDAARRGDIAHLRRLIEVQGEAVNQYDYFDASPLYCACAGSSVSRTTSGASYYDTTTYCPRRRGPMWPCQRVRVPP